MVRFFILHILTTITILLGGCIAKQSAGNRSTLDLINSPSNVPLYSSYVMTQNPVYRSGGKELDMNISLSSYLDPTPQFITNQQILNDYLTINYPTATQNYPLNNVRIEVKQTESSSYLVQNSGTWAYDANSYEFQEVNTFYLLKKESKFFQEALWNQATMGMNNTSMPAMFSFNNAYWPYSINPITNTQSPLTLSAYTRGMDDKNAAFYPAEFVLRFGIDEELSGAFLKTLDFTQDPTIVFHEIGHAMVHIMMNIRNLNAGETISTKLGYRFYDEAGAINEGIADFFSYALTGTTHFGDWALGNFYHASRPICESDPLHVAGISETPSERLRYPDFLQYDPNEPKQLYEDIHQAGMIASHYLVALSKQLQDRCAFSSEDANKYIMGLLAETMAYLGDLTATGRDNNGGEYLVNLNPNNALEWMLIANPITYRRFFQTFATKLNLLRQHMLSFNTCNTLTQDDIEQLLDEYGLLLFDSYNDDGNSVDINMTTQINPLNRQISTLISKDNLILNPTPGAPIAYVFDQQETIAAAIQSFVASGFINPSTDLASPDLIPADYSYNNENGRISPGELVGVSLNLYNNSNTSMGGVQILANDWDHANSEGKPCRVFSNGIEDSWPSPSEGAAPDDDASCMTTTTDNSDTAPVCFLLLDTGDATEWVTQEKFRAEKNLESKNCLGGAENTNDCYVRAVHNLNTSFYSKIDSHKTWIETITAAGQPLKFHSSNLLFFEINPWIPPGTRVNCRLRVRFTNCQDCYQRTKDGKNDDFDDYEYSGAQPFQLINFQFTVID